MKELLELKEFAKIEMEEAESPYSYQLSNVLVAASEPVQTYVSKAGIRGQFYRANTRFTEVKNRVNRDTTENIFLPKADFIVYPDQYVQLESMFETLKEIVPGVFIREKKGAYSVTIFAKEYGRSFDGAPYLFIDEQPVFSLDSLLALDPANVRRIDSYSFLNTLGQFGGIGSYGILSVYTKNKLYNPSLADWSLVIEVNGYSGKTTGSPQRVRPTADGSLPRLNPLVHWYPDSQKGTGTRRALTYPQSDEVSDFSLVVEGFTARGQYFNAVKTYTSRVVK